MENLYRAIAKAGQSAHRVLILGESGTGKELVAKSIHLGSVKRVPINVGVWRRPIGILSARSRRAVSGTTSSSV